MRINPLHFEISRNRTGSIHFYIIIHGRLIHLLSIPVFRMIKNSLCGGSFVEKAVTAIFRPNGLDLHRSIFQRQDLPIQTKAQVAHTV